MVFDWQGMATHQCALKNCPSQDSDFIAKFDRRKDAQFLDKSRLVTQALEILAKAVYRRIFENPCVGGSIPPRATKKHQNHLRVVFSFPLFINCPLKGQTLSQN